MSHRCDTEALIYLFLFSDGINQINLFQTELPRRLRERETAKMGSTDNDQFCLRCNDFQQCIKSTFQDLRDEKDFMDVTVSCDGEQVKAHKVILSACSDSFRNLLKKNPAQHPVIVLWVGILAEWSTLIGRDL